VENNNPYKRFCYLLRMTKISSVAYLSLFLVIMSLSLASSQTLIAGKIYNSGFSSTISGADVSVTCNSQSLHTNTLGDGTYAVRFEETECIDGDSVSVSASKSGFQGKTGNGIVSKCEGDDCSDNYVIIINLGMKTQTSGSGSGEGRSWGKYYMCGNGKCDSGESINTCPADCKTVQLLAQKTEPTGNSDNSNSGGQTGILNLTNETTEETQTETTNAGFFPGMTGATVGALGALGTFWTIIIVLFLVGVICVAIILRITRKRKFDWE
jgi:hypothetical protein